MLTTTFGKVVAAKGFGQIHGLRPIFEIAKNIRLHQYLLNIRSI
jgi:hypothetical protein